MELIDKETAYKELSEFYHHTAFIQHLALSEALDRVPVVDAEPVKHGKWIVEYKVKDGRSVRCSECQMVFWVGSGRDGNYCPNCGAKMDGEKEKEKVFWSRYLLKPCAEEEEGQNDKTD